MQRARSGGPLEGGIPIPENAPALLKSFDRDKNGRMTEEEIEAMPPPLRDRVRSAIRERTGGSRPSFPMKQNDSNGKAGEKEQSNRFNVPATRTRFPLSKPTLDLTIAVRDLKKADEFYGTILGMTALSQERLASGEHVHRYQFGTTVFDLIAFNSVPKPVEQRRMQDVRGYRVLTLTPADLDAIEARGKTAGYAAWKSPLPGGPVRMWADPDGNVIELIDGKQAASMSDGLVSPMGVMVGIVVNDAKRSQEFYGDQLGCQLLQERPARAIGAVGYYYKIGETIVKFWAIEGDLPNTSGPPSAHAGYRHLTISVNDLDIVRKDLQRQKLSFVAESNENEFWVEDPDGNRIRFVCSNP